jgi:hypothetical protein
MSKMSREEKLFRNENKVLDHYQTLLLVDTPLEDTHHELKKLTHKYKNLLDQTRFLTWISGRLERKLQRTNRELFKKNQDLQKTLDDLTKAEAGRSAYAIIYFIAIVLFVLEELFIEPLINMVSDNVGYGILMKLLIVLVLKLSEGIIERKITKQKVVERSNKNDW